MKKRILALVMAIALLLPVMALANTTGDAAASKRMSAVGTFMASQKSTSDYRSLKTLITKGYGIDEDDFELVFDAFSIYTAAGTENNKELAKIDPNSTLYFYHVNEKGMIMSYLMVPRTDGKCEVVVAINMNGSYLGINMFNNTYTSLKAAQNDSKIPTGTFQCLEIPAMAFVEMAGSKEMSNIGSRMR